MRRGRRGNSTYNGVVIRRADSRTVKAGFLNSLRDLPRRNPRRNAAGSVASSSSSPARAYDAHPARRSRRPRNRAPCLDPRSSGRWRDPRNPRARRGAEAVRAGVSNDALDRACVELRARYDYTMAYSETRRFETIRFFGILASSIREGRHVTDRDDNPLDVARLIEYARHTKNNEASSRQRTRKRRSGVFRLGGYEAIRERGYKNTWFGAPGLDRNEAAKELQQQRERDHARESSAGRDIARS